MSSGCCLTKVLAQFIPTHPTSHVASSQLPISSTLDNQGGNPLESRLSMCSRIVDSPRSVSLHELADILHCDRMPRWQWLSFSWSMWYILPAAQALRFLSFCIAWRANITWLSSCFWGILGCGDICGGSQKSRWSDFVWHSHVGYVIQKQQPNENNSMKVTSTQKQNASL